MFPFFLTIADCSIADQIEQIDTYTCHARAHTHTHTRPCLDPAYECSLNHSRSTTTTDGIAQRMTDKRSCQSYVLDLMPIVSIVDV